MNRRELAGYVWDYYKLHIVFGFACILVLGSLLNTLVINPEKESYISVAVYGEFVPYESIAALESLLNEVLVPDELKPRWKATAENFFQSESDPMGSMALSQKFSALLFMGELDIIIAESSVFDDMLTDGVFFLLEGLITTEPEDLFVRGMAQEDALNRVYGLDLTGSRVLALCNIELVHPVAGIVVSSKRHDISLQALQLLLSEYSSER
jgi:hypothetical protein